MDKHELIEWMGVESTNGSDDMVRYVVDCPSRKAAQGVADLISEICECDEFNVGDEENTYWKYIFLSKAYNGRVHVNAYSSALSRNPIRGAKCISSEEFFSAVGKSATPVAIDDLL